MFFRKSFLFLHQKPFASHQFPFNFSTVPPKPNIPLKVQKQLKEKDMYDRLKSQLQATFVEVIDTSNSGCIYFSLIISFGLTNLFKLFMKP